MPHRSVLVVRGFTRVMTCMVHEQTGRSGAGGMRISRAAGKHCRGCISLHWQCKHQQQRKKYFQDAVHRESLAWLVGSGSAPAHPFRHATMRFLSQARAFFADIGRAMW